MKIIAHIELTDDERVRFQKFLTDGASSKPATRAQVRDFVSGSVASALALGETAGEESSSGADLFNSPESFFPARGTERPTVDLERIDPEDYEFLKDKSVGFIRGWNNAKRRVRAYRQAKGTASPQS